MTTNIPSDVDALLTRGLRDLWYPICPSTFVKDSPISLRRLGYKLAIWRDRNGKVHALEDHCPHRGAPFVDGCEPRRSAGLPVPWC